MISFMFNVNRSFLDQNSHPITILKRLHERLEENGLADTESITVVCPDRSRMEGHIYNGEAGYGPYYQISINGHPGDSLSQLAIGDSLGVEISRQGERVYVRLTLDVQR